MSFLTPWKVSGKAGYLSLCEKYLERIQKTTPTEHVVPSRPLKTKEEVDAFLLKEAQKYEKLGFHLIFLDENGEQQTTEKFAEEIRGAFLKGFKGICFCLGDAFGLPASLRTLNKFSIISLSKLTFAHELALVVLLEQIFRAQMIFANHPYHHGGASALSKSK